MKHKLRYNRNYTVTLIPEPTRRKPEIWSMAAIWCAMLIATAALSAGSTVVALAEQGSVLTSLVDGVTGSVLGS